MNSPKFTQTSFAIHEDGTVHHKTHEETMVRHYGRQPAVLATIGAASLLTVGGVLYTTWSSHDKALTEQVAALESHRMSVNGGYVLKGESVEAHRLPSTQSDIVYRLGKDAALVVERPQTNRLDKTGRPGWIAVTMPNADPSTFRDAAMHADQTMYIDPKLLTGKSATRFDLPGTVPAGYAAIDYTNEAIGVSFELQGPAIDKFENLFAHNLLKQG